MYFLVPYNLSPIQQAIQAGHASMEYALKYWKDKDFQDWAKKWKTWIVLNGGTSNSGDDKPGTMDQYLELLLENDIKVADFCEPDLNNALTAIAFICDERVFDYENYPSFQNFIYKKHNSFIDTSKEIEFRTKVMRATGDNKLPAEFPKEYKEWAKQMGGAQNAFLREFLVNFELA